MNVGDLVKYKNLHGHVRLGKFISKSWTGIVLRIKDEKAGLLTVLWSTGHIAEEFRSALEVTNIKLQNS